MWKNPYRGINPHINSLLQSPSTDEQPTLWPSFHARHITNIGEFLDAQLPPNYIAMTEQSLQLREDWGGIGGIIRRPEPDTTIFQTRPTLTHPPESAEIAFAPTFELSIEDSVDPEDLPMAITIRPLMPQRTLGRIVARIELLSPSNKRGGSNYAAYATKRIECLRSGIPLIEIDYLHETISPILGVLPYPDSPDSTAYLITVSDPRPEWDEGRVRGYGFSVDEPVRTLPLPLADDEQLVFDFDGVYQYTLAHGPWHKLVDDRERPLRFETYSAADQGRIMKRMAES